VTSFDSERDFRKDMIPRLHKLTIRQDFGSRQKHVFEGLPIKTGRAEM